MLFRSLCQRRPGLYTEGLEDSSQMPGGTAHGGRSACDADYALGLARARPSAATYEMGCNLTADGLDARLHLLIERARWCLCFQRRSR